MRITHFQIKNYRNIRLAECTNPPDFMVIGGGNGCGKSALLSALMTAKESAGSYGSFHRDLNAVFAGANESSISIMLEFTQEEQAFAAALAAKK